MAGRRRLWPPPEESLEGIRRHLAAGGVLVVPTESSYGLAADPRNSRGVRGVYILKGRDWDKPLPVAVSDIGDLPLLGVTVPETELAALKAVWPAPLTVVLELASPLPASAGQSTLAVRVPEHSGLRRLLEAVGPLTVTSANLSGEAPALRPEEVEGFVSRGSGGQEAGPEVLMFDAGVLPGGPPSTLVRRRKLAGREEAASAGAEWEVLRAGAFPVADLVFNRSAEQPLAPVGRNTERGV